MVLLGAKRAFKTFYISFIGAKKLLPIYRDQNRIVRVNASLGALQESGSKKFFVMGKTSVGLPIIPPVGRRSLRIGFDSPGLSQALTSSGLF